MSSKRHIPEQIINKLRQTEVELAKGATVAQVLVEGWRSVDQKPVPALLAGICERRRA